MPEPRFAVTRMGTEGMLFRNLTAAFFCFQIALSPLFAQDNSTNSAPNEGALPEVEVTPPSDPSLPEVEVSPPPEVTTPFDSTVSYPSLTDQVFGQNSGDFGQSTGILRNQKSLFDSPIAGSITTRQQLSLIHI